MRSSSASPMTTRRWSRSEGESVFHSQASLLVWAMPATRLPSPSASNPYASSGGASPLPARISTPLNNSRVPVSGLDSMARQVERPGHPNCSAGLSAEAAAACGAVGPSSHQDHAAPFATPASTDHRRAACWPPRAGFQVPPLVGHTAEGGAGRVACSPTRGTRRPGRTGQPP